MHENVILNCGVNLVCDVFFYNHVQQPCTTYSFTVCLKSQNFMPHFIPVCYQAKTYTNEDKTIFLYATKNAVIGTEVASELLYVRGHSTG